MAPTFAPPQADRRDWPDAGFRWFVWIDLLLPWLILFWLLCRY